MLTRRAFLSLALLSWSVTGLGFEVLHDYSGSTFFNGWDYYGLWDNLTLGNVTYLSAEAATQQRLTYVNDAGNAIIRVDNFTTVSEGDRRNSIRITSSEFYEYGSLWIIDALHLPYGCSVWPAFWSKGSHWPNDGEIDIIEAINLMPNNQMALHTTEGCVHNTTAPQTGFNIDNDCGTASGCTVGMSSPNSYESGFAAAGGGVYATQFDVSGIYMWFWSRPNVPDSITSATANSSMNISSWGPPTASYPTNAYCNITNFFSAQQLIFDITLCGDWAGVPGTYDGTGCANAGPNNNCYLDNVVGNGSNYDEAYFEVAYVRTYTTGVVLPASTATSTSVASSSSGSQTSTPSRSQKSDAWREHGSLEAFLAASAVAMLAGCLFTLA
ncbi:uncharacterized protein FIBRA_04605 [Fibroporia radiculosa]|uniref:GH16 domain-containing protein n=1 Tax=Fibroporia radiculosa TaxID=599839 RepID=J4G7M8_9APHY|nr:uncharacterized protein FIBRA_04605 [Fibroporia radiculosa]CCM02503.1 predicted protein [Fibroporia radiculosa]